MESIGADEQINDDANIVLKWVSAAILTIAHLMYFATTFIVPAIILGWGLVSDYKYSHNQIAQAIYYRAQILLYCHLLFPVIALVASLFAWNYHFCNAFKKAIIVALIPSLVVLSYFILLRYY